MKTVEPNPRDKLLNAKLINAALRGVYEKAGELVEDVDFSNGTGDRHLVIAQTVQSLTKEIMALNPVRETDWDNLTENEAHALREGAIQRPPS